MPLAPMILLAATGVTQAASLPLTYEAAMQQALSRNPTLVQAGLDVEAAEGVALGSRGIFDPQLTANTGLAGSRSESVGQFGETRSDFNSLSWGTSISQYAATGTSLSLGWANSRNTFTYELLDIPGFDPVSDVQFDSSLSLSATQSLLEGHRRASNMKMVRDAERATDMAELTAQATRQQTLSDVATAYWSLWYQERLVEIAEQSVAVAIEEERIVRARVEAGDLAPVEAARVRSAAVQAQQLDIEARHAAAGARDALLLLIGEEPGQNVQLQSRPDAPEDVRLDPDRFVSEALGNNASLQVMRLWEENSRMSLADARHRRLPQLSATGSLALTGYEASQTAAVREMLDGDLPEWYIGGNLSAPLGNRVDRGNVLSAQAELGRARVERESLERAIAQQVRAHVRTIESARAQLDLAALNLDLATQTLAADRALREAGRAIERDVLESMKNLDDARVAVEKARADYALALVELDRLSGAL